MPEPTLTELEPGLGQIPMPLPWALDHVHCYALAGPGGWTLVDAGLGSDATLRWWAQALAELGPEPVVAVSLNKKHPDHVGASAGLAELSGAPQVVQGRLDRAMAVAAWEQGSDDEFEGYLRDHGMPAELAAASTRAASRTGVRLATPTMLVDEDDLVLLGGDVLLDEITPNVGRWPDTARDPLGRYLATLRRLSELAPRRVYPGHGPVIDDAPSRAGEIAAHHDERLDAAAAALDEGAETAYDAAQLIWRDEPLGFHEQRFALVEAISHLERLAETGRARQPSPRRWRPPAG